MRRMMLAVATLVFSTAAQAAEPALTPALLTKQEVTEYQAMKSNPTAAHSFLDTRGLSDFAKKWFITR